MARNPAAKPNPAVIADEQAKCFELKRRGYSVRRIADETGIARSTVQDRLDAAYKEMVFPLADEVRLLELERLDAWLVRLEDQMTNGEAPERVVPVAIRVSERRAKLLGLDAPERQEMTVAQLGSDDASVLDVLARARQAADARIAALRGAEGQA